MMDNDYDVSFKFSELNLIYNCLLETKAKDKKDLMYILEDEKKLIPDIRKKIEECLVN